MCVCVFEELLQTGKMRRNIGLWHNSGLHYLGAIKVLRNTVGWDGVSFPRKKCYEGVRFNVISVTCQISRKKALRNTGMAPYGTPLKAEL